MTEYNPDAVTDSPDRQTGRQLTPQQKAEGYTIRPDGSLWHPDDFLGSGKRMDHYFTDMGDKVSGPLLQFGIPPMGTYLLLLGSGGYLVWRMMR